MTPDDPRHGTRRGYRAHWVEGEGACDPCLRANSRYKNQILIEQDRGTTRKRPVIGAQRRVRALQRLGWSVRTIAREGGWENTETIVGLLRAQPDSYITIPTFAAIRAVYDRLAMQIPPSGSGVTRARNYATKQGWPAPLEWDNIDDPDERPSVGSDANGPGHDEVDPIVVARILAGDYQLRATRAEKEAVVARWQGSLAELERRLGWKADRYTKRQDGAA